MGQDIATDRFKPEDFTRFAERLRLCCEVFAELLEKPGFGRGEPSVGGEAEVFLIDHNMNPLHANHKVITGAMDPRLDYELDRFNLECNLDPTPLAGAPFTALGDQLNSIRALVGEAAGAHGGRVAMIGILPTFREGDFTPGAMTEIARYRALARELRQGRGNPFEVHINGEETLDVTCDTVAFEGANTSFQLHLKVDPREFAAAFNGCQLATGPALAAAGNSPVFLEHLLWQETRIPLFQQAVDDRANPTLPHRVAFGNGWLRGGARELFDEFVANHRPLLPITTDEPISVECDGPDGPELGELRLHMGTVWRWNRPVYDPASGGHLRLEMRSLPAGPSTIDMLANAAFLIGLTLHYAEEPERWLDSMDFAQAQANFYGAAQLGLDAEMAWPKKDGGVKLLTGAQLVGQLLEPAELGLSTAGVDPAESSKLLEIIEERARTGRTGSSWQRDVIKKLERTSSRREALVGMLKLYLEYCDSGTPVHEWPD